MLYPRILPEASRRWRPSQHRRILCVFPKYAHSFGTFQYSYPLLPRVRAFMPPQGILIVSAYLPPEWEVRFVDENLRPATERDMRWADAVFISGMHVQKTSIDRINDLAHRAGRLTVLGGPSVSGCPDYYPDVDVLHIGELGDATDELIRMLDSSIDRPSRQCVLTTGERLPLENFPSPAYDRLDMTRYFLGSVQFSSGCPFLCEFCDIPALYGRNPRLKRPEQVVGELDAMLTAGLRGAVYFVDDNFIANPAAARALLPHLIDWQRRTGYRVRLCCEATLNLASHEDILAQMREANFSAVFCGIETPEPAGLELMRKKQNMRQPILDSVRRINAHGMEVVAGIILGLDSDTPRTGANIVRFIEESRIPMLTINLLYALPRTPLYQRLEAEGRLTNDPQRPSNVLFKMDDEQVVGMWRQVIREAYEPARLLERFRSQTIECYPNRLPGPTRVTPSMLRHGVSVVARTLWRVGMTSDYRREFWELCRPLLRQGRIEEVMHIGIVSNHLIRFARDCQTQKAEASFYADPNRAEAAVTR